MAVAIDAGDCGDVVAEATNVTELYTALRKFNPSIVVVDLSMDEPGVPDGLAMVATIQRRHPDLKVLVVTMSDSAALVDALVSFGVSGIISKNDDIGELIDAIAQCGQVGTYISKSFQYECLVQRLSQASGDLTKAEIDVLRQLSNKLSVTEIAQRRSRSVATISRQKTSAMKKLGINNSRQLHSYLSSLRGDQNGV
ncbi:DNA-binding response regulator [Stenotrophomonas sp. YAU14A_MKIMI4_1]|nr:DNA-binding response regulator [Stenotrophomonas sp. YAU14A_MKIMI4_1]